jgi:hypothetical protein
MNESTLLAQIAGGDSSQKFKVDIRDAEALSAKMSAFANSEGVGCI